VVADAIVVCICTAFEFGENAIVVIVRVIEIEGSVIIGITTGFNIIGDGVVIAIDV
jgi:hypothetical protein